MATDLKAEEITEIIRQQLTGIPTPRGVAVADDVGMIFVTSTPSHLVLIDNQSLAEITRILEQSADAFAECLRGGEGREGVTAFLEKRRARWAE